MAVINNLHNDKKKSKDLNGSYLQASIKLYTLFTEKVIEQFNNKKFFIKRYSLTRVKLIALYKQLLTKNTWIYISTVTNRTLNIVVYHKNIT